MHGLWSGHDFVVIGTPTENGVFADYEKGAIDVPMENGVMNGKGTEKLTKNNEEYTLECTWVNGKKNGEAVLLDSNSVMSMKLFFKDDLIEGEGYLYDNGQVTFKGTWVAGKRCGFGQEFQGGKLIFKGQYKDDVRNGYGTLYDANGEVAFEGEWVDGKEGESTIEEDDNGDRVLVVKKDGVLVYRGGFKEGTMVKDGKGVLYNSEGKPEKVCIFKEGTIDRMVKEFKENTIVIYDANGKKVYEGEYLNDSQGRYPANGSGRAFHNGALIYKGDWVRGRRQGHGCSYYENHMLKYEGDWQNDQANGNGKFFDAEGMLVLEGEFVDGVGTDGEKRVLVESGKVESATKSGGCACFGGRKEGRRQLPVMGEEENPAGKGMVVVRTMKEFTAVPPQTVGICFAADSMNETEVAILDFARFENLRRVQFDAGCCQTVKQVRFRELAKLKSVVVHAGALSNRECSARAEEKQYTIQEMRRELCFEACAALSEVRIERGACVDFMKLVLSDLPALTELSIGDADADVKMHSDCFYWTEALRVVDLPALTTLTVGNYCFAKVKTVTIKDLPKLERVCFGAGACTGLPNLFDEGNNTTEWRNLPALTELVVRSNAFKNHSELKLVNLPSLTDGEKVVLDEGAFAGLKALKHDDLTSEALLEAVKKDHEIKVSKLKKRS